MKRMKTINSKIAAIKFLRLFFDPTLSFKYHVEKILSKTLKSTLHNEDGEKTHSTVKR
jgi:hypothetical protein